MTNPLFDLIPADNANVNGIPAHFPIRDEQILAIREAFVVAAIEGQKERRQIVESTSLRPIASLRELYAHEAQRVLQRIKQRATAAPHPEGASAWDQREEDTWIDKL